MMPSGKVSVRHDNILSETHMFAIHDHLVHLTSVIVGLGVGASPCWKKKESKLR
jgi:hypothetical protein